MHGFCPFVDTSCSPLNTCRTCDTFAENGGVCREIDFIPNASIGRLLEDDFLAWMFLSITLSPSICNLKKAEYGQYVLGDKRINKKQNLDDAADNSNLLDMVEAIKAEIFARGPVVASINGHGLANYTGGIFTDSGFSKRTTHAVSIVGWGRSIEDEQDYWIVRNSVRNIYIQHNDVIVVGSVSV